MIVRTTIDFCVCQNRLFYVYCGCCLDSGFFVLCLWTVLNILNCCPTMQHVIRILIAKSRVFTFNVYKRWRVHVIANCHQQRPLAKPTSYQFLVLRILVVGICLRSIQIFVRLCTYLYDVYETAYYFLMELDLWHKNECDIGLMFVVQLPISKYSYSTFDSNICSRFVWGYVGSLLQ